MEQGMVNVPICEIIVLDVFVFKSEIIQNNSLFYTIDLMTVVVSKTS